MNPLELFVLIVCYGVMTIFALAVVIVVLALLMGIVGMIVGVIRPKDSKTVKLKAVKK